MKQKRASLSRQFPRKTESRLDRIEGLLNYAENQIDDIVKTYEGHPQGGHVPLELAIKIKNCCENMRSALDYLAHYIFEQNYPGQPIPSRLFFPLERTRKEADKAINKQFPGLRKINRAAWRALHELQPYKRANRWLRRFLSVVNDHKHWDLVAQRVRQVDVNSPRAQGFAPLAFIDEERGIVTEYRFRGIEENAVFLLQQTRVNIQYLVLAFF